MAHDPDTLGTFARETSKELHGLDKRITTAENKLSDIIDARRTCKGDRDVELRKLEDRMIKLEINVALLTQRVATGAAVGALLASVIVQLVFKFVG